MAAKKRTTKKASNSIVEPKPTTSSNGRRIAILVIVVLGIVIWWRNNDPDPIEKDGPENNNPIETTVNPGGEDGKDLNYDPEEARKHGSCRRERR